MVYRHGAPSATPLMGVYVWLLPIRHEFFAAGIRMKKNFIILATKCMKNGPQRTRNHLFHSGLSNYPLKKYGLKVQGLRNAWLYNGYLGCCQFVACRVPGGFAAVLGGFAEMASIDFGGFFRNVFPRKLIDGFLSA